MCQVSQNLENFKSLVRYQTFLYTPGYRNVVWKDLEGIQSNLFVCKSSSVFHPTFLDVSLPCTCIQKPISGSRPWSRLLWKPAICREFWKKGYGHEIVDVQGFQRESTRMRRYKIIKVKITWGSLVKLDSLVGDWLWTLVLCLIFVLMEDCKLEMLGFLSREPWKVTLTLLTHACLLSKNFLSSLTWVVSIVMLCLAAH